MILFLSFTKWILVRRALLRSALSHGIKALQNSVFVQINDHTIGRIYQYFYQKIHDMVN